MFNFDLGLMTITLLPFILIAENFVRRQKRGDLWRRTAIWIIQTVFWLNQIEIKTKHLDEAVNRQGVIFAANHPSHLDGFLLLTILGRNNILFTAPLGQFPAVLRIWMRKMEAVDVRRDLIDDKRYPEAHSKEQAIQKAIHHLRAGQNLIIFPEGHLEILHVLHYFHTGASRIAISGHTPIIPVSIVNAEQLFPDQHHLYQGAILISFGQPIKPPNKQNKISTPARGEVLKLRQRIEHAIAEKLPLRYLPNYYRQRSKHIGVFIDIDRTIYQGLSQKDLIAYLFWLHKIHSRDAFKIFYWLFLEKLRQIEHADLMRQALLVLRGWDAAELNHEIHRAFEKKLMDKIQYGIFPLIKDHVEENHSVVLVSEVIHPLAREFKNFLDATGTLDTKLKTVHHCYTGETDCLCYKNEKARLVADFAERAGIELAKSYALADSGSDLPFLKLVKHPIAVNPDDELLDFAVEHDWQVILDAA